MIRLYLFIAIIFSLSTAVAASGDSTTGNSTNSNNKTGDTTIVPPEDPTQSIRYWKPYTIAPEQDSDVSNAHAIFATLLRSWSSTRVAPALYVVKSSAGPWAASLADGNILLSRDAISASKKFGENRADHLLAFILSHELAHQRADDLWHQKFFRMAGNKSQEIKQQMFSGLELNRKNITDLQRREAQADNDGLIIMATVGYDPYQIIDQKDFFTTWVENIWQQPCDSGISQNNRQACRQAMARSLRTRTHLATVASQSTLFELGTQAFVSGRYDEARRYFEAFGRDFPSRAVHTSIALSYLSQASNEYQQLISSKIIQHPDFFYPMMLDSGPHATPITSPQGKRGIDIIAKEKIALIRKLTNKSINHIEKAIQLEPEHRDSYIYLAMSYLLESNTYMARGIIQGKYVPHFGKDIAVDLILAMTSAIEGNHRQAESEFKKLVGYINNRFDYEQKDTAALSRDLVIYSSFFNYAALLEFNNRKSESGALWETLAENASANGNSVLFRLALGQIKPDIAPRQQFIDHPLVNNQRPGDTFSPQSSTRQNYSSENQSSEIWLEGEQLKVYRYTNGARLVINQHDKIVSAWQTDTWSEQDENTRIANISLGENADRAIKALGIPDKRIHMVKGEYLTYDNIGLAVHILNNKISGWFLYDPV